MEQEQPLSTPEPLTTRERYDGLLREITAQSERQAPDRYMKAFYKRCLGELETNPEFFETTWEYLEANPHDEPTYGANKLFRAVQYEVIPVANPAAPGVPDHDYRDPDYPRGRQRPEAWDDAFEAIQQPFGRYLFRQNLIHNPIQTNVAQRGSVLRVAAQLYGLKKPKIYSGGCSMGHIEKLMGLYDGEMFDYPPVAFGHRDPERLMGFVRSKTLSQYFTALLRNREFKLGQSLGDDLGPPTFSAALDWARSCTFRPSEFADVKRRSLVQRLIETELPQLKFHQGDFTLPGHVTYLRDKNPRWQKDRFDMAIFATSLYQCNEPGQREQAIENALELVHDEGIIAVLDFAHRDPDDKHKLNFVPKWRDWDYNLHVLDKLDQSSGWKHIFGIREGRVREVVLGRDLGRVAFGAMREDAA